MRGLITTALASAVVTLAGCGLFSEDAALDISTDRTVYPRGSMIKVTAKNVSSDVIYYNTCMATVLEELKHESVTDRIFLPTCACLCVTDLKPGETWEWSLDSGWLWANEGMFEPTIGPRHRFRFEFYEDSELKRLISSGDLKTNSFRFENADAPTGAN